MSEQNEKLTAEELESTALALSGEMNLRKKEYDQQTAELRKELEHAKELNRAGDKAGELLNSFYQTSEDERLKLETQVIDLKTQLAEAQRQMDEALKALKEETQELHELLLNAPIDFLQGGNDIDFADQEEGEFREAISLVMMRVEATISRLSSGETKPDE